MTYFNGILRRVIQLRTKSMDLLFGSRPYTNNSVTNNSPSFTCSSKTMLSSFPYPFFERNVNYTYVRSLLTLTSCYTASTFQYYISSRSVLLHMLMIDRVVMESYTSTRHGAFGERFPKY